MDIRESLEYQEEACRDMEVVLNQYIYRALALIYSKYQVQPANISVFMEAWQERAGKASSHRFAGSSVSLTADETRPKGPMTKFKEIAAMDSPHNLKPVALRNERY